MTLLRARQMNKITIHNFMKLLHYMRAALLEKLSERRWNRHRRKHNKRLRKCAMQISRAPLSSLILFVNGRVLLSGKARREGASSGQAPRSSPS